MDMTNIKEGNGFVCKKKFFNMMCRLRPPESDFYRMKKSPKTNFVSVGVMAYGTAFMPLFKIYAGNEELYEHIKGIFMNLCSVMGYQGRADDWRPCDDDNR